MKNTIILLSGLLSINVFAGSAQVKLDCVSDSGLTTVKASVPGDDTGDYSVTITITRDRIPYSISYSQYYSENGLVKNGTVTVVDGIEFKDKVYKIKAEKNDNSAYAKENTIYAIPNTVEIRNGENSRKATFRAKLSGFNPRKVGAPENGEERDYPYNIGDEAIELKCTYDYSI